jgi:hypothetical protein
MIVKILGLLDLMCVFAIIFNSIIPTNIIMNLGMLLAMKGIIFASMKNIGSIIDAFGGFYLGFIVYGATNNLISWFLILYLGQKGILSLFAR